MHTNIPCTPICCIISRPVHGGVSHAQLLHYKTDRLWLRLNAQHCDWVQIEASDLLQWQAYAKRAIIAPVVVVVMYTLCAYIRTV